MITIPLIFLTQFLLSLLNPAEKMWAKYKRAFSNKFHACLEDVDDFITEVVNTTSKKEVMSIYGYGSIFFFDKIWTI